jgi:hypothetical protein
MGALVSHGWIRHDRRSSRIDVTPKGRAEFRRQFGIDASPQAPRAPAHLRGGCASTGCASTDAD